MLGVKREGGSFQPLVWENVVDTLPGGLILDLTGYTPVNGVVPAGTMVGKDPATGLGKIVGDPAVVGAPTPIGYTIRDTPAEEGNTLVNGVGISGTIREAALPTGQGTLAARVAALPRITHV
ncbi:hypothetical protein I2I11_04165 [Pontibacter sp. 172403-2]|uniref:hypothetical protein n=1 Tax=Pontibacter rufus TaxID=2791028 RepID=UPI0018AFB2E0|nr:hypothetical protein [Pontibacter sp. 172403-2]MBF9252479.1 hypothetical protein [Pontibacter sp. 172403-2]